MLLIISSYRSTHVLTLDVLCVCVLLTTVSPAKTDELIKM